VLEDNCGRGFVDSILFRVVKKNLEVWYTLDGFEKRYVFKKLRYKVEALDS